MLSYRVALGAVTVLGLGAATMVSALPAEAANWDTVLTVHKARTQLCKEPAGGGWKLKVRLDNRNADHSHNAGFSRNGEQVNVRARAGEVSKVKWLIVQRGDDLVVGMGEPTGEGLGGDFALSDIAAC